MRPGRDSPPDHWGDDELDEPISSPSQRGIFAADSKLQDSIAVVQNAGPIALVDARTKGEVPQLITVNLAATMGALAPAKGGPLAANWYEALAIIEYGVGGTAYQVEVDYGVGVQFSMLASRVRIAAEVRDLPGTQPPNPALAPSLTLGASVGQGVVAVARPPTRTLSYAWPGWAGYMAVGAFYDFVVPTFAKSLRIYAHSNVPGGTPVVAADFYGATGATVWRTPAAAAPSPEIPLTNDIRTLRVWNTGLIEIDNLRLVFALSL